MFVMTKYTHKYKLMFSLLFLLLSGVVWGQASKIDSIVVTANVDQFMFDCNKATPIDLYKAAGLFVSPENGYWGDIYGVPYDGNPSAYDPSPNKEATRERQYTNGNIFNTPKKTVDTVMYRFYFYFTSVKGYCGITNNTRLVLDVPIAIRSCIDPANPNNDAAYLFCYGTNIDMNRQRDFGDGFKIKDLIWKTEEDNPILNNEWMKLDIYSDSLHTHWVGDENMLINTSPQTWYDSSYYIILHQESPRREYSLTVEVVVYPQAQIEIYYSPDIKNDITKEYGIDDNVTIRVEDSETFQYYNYFLNSKHLNKYYMGGDSTRNEITLSALVFSGVEDFVEVIARDTNNCIVKKSDNVVVNVPFPNVFTPDGDGTNDVFYGGDKFRNREFTLEVFNRWGNRLYFGSSGWDGKYRGVDVPPGNFEYVIHLKLSDGSTKMVKGTVTLIRKGL
jgi:gliding motility-associated-like protein